MAVVVNPGLDRSVFARCVHLVMHHKSLLGIALHGPNDSSLTKTLQFAAIPITDIEIKERSKAWADGSTSTQLTRSKSMEYLPRQRTISTSALRELFESKVAMKPKSLHKPKNTKKPQGSSGTENAGLNQSSAEDLLVFIETDSINNSNSKKSAEPTKEKEDNLTPKVARAPRVEIRKTFTGVNTERIVTQSEDKRKSVADFRDSSTLDGREKFPISVKAISELYLSKVAAAEPTGNLLKPLVKNHTNDFTWSAGIFHMER
ncbi:hypothetical protein QTP86_012187 [Hemibagrus guttatus]|nr:hypothetical protein QTP86_012187 [Hemibagrus guttatus]